MIAVVCVTRCAAAFAVAQNGGDRGHAFALMFIKFVTTFGKKRLEPIEVGVSVTCGENSLIGMRTGNAMHQ